MHTGRSLESGDRISIEIRRIWHRSTARNMPITTAGQKLNTPNRIRRSASRLAVRDDHSVPKTSKKRKMAALQRS